MSVTHILITDHPMSQRGMSHSDADQTDHPMYIVGKIVSAPTNGQGAFLRSPSLTSSCPSSPSWTNFRKLFALSQEPTRSSLQWQTMVAYLSFSSTFSLFTSGSNYMVISTCTTCAFLMFLPEPLFRAAEKEWIAFIESLTDILIQVDPQLPPLPPKDLIHRIYRDVGLLSFSLPLFSPLPLDSFQQRQDPLQTSLFCLLFKNRQKRHLCRL